MFNARHHEAHSRTFEPRPAAQRRDGAQSRGSGDNVRPLRPNTIRLAVRPVAPRLVDGEGFAPEGVAPPPPFDGILKLLELLESDSLPPHRRD